MVAACGGADAPAGEALTTAEPQNQNVQKPPVDDASSPLPADAAPEPPAGDPEANTLIIYAIPAPSSTLNPGGLSWSSPGDLVRGTLLNEAGGLALNFTRTIGHVAITVKCAATANAPEAHYQSGMTNRDSDDFNDLVLKQQIGFGMLFDNVPGELETEARVQQTIDERKQSGLMRFVRFQIAEDVCRGLLGYAAAYQAENVQKNYGLEARPLYKEGAGCSAYGMSYLQLANLLEPRFVQGWSFSVRVPMWSKPLHQPLIGGTKNPRVRVPIQRLAALSQPWAAPDEEGIDLFGWDPTRMYKWLDARTTEALADGSEKVESMGNARGLVLDRRTVAPTAPLKNRTYFNVP